MKYNIISPNTVSLIMYQTNTVDKSITPVINASVELVEDNSNNTLTGGVYHVRVIKDTEKASFVYSSYLNGNEENWYFEYEPSKGWCNKYTEFINLEEEEYAVTLTVSIKDITLEFFNVLQEYIRLKWRVKKVTVDDSLIKFTLSKY